MGEVIEFRKKHWTGLDADLASIPSPGVGDTYFATDKKKLYYWEGAGWKTGLGYEYVPRDVTAWDKQIGDFVFDGTLKVDGLDLSGIVPVGAKAIHVYFQMRSGAANKTFYVQQNAVNVINGHTVVTQIANVYTPAQHGIIQCDSDRKFDYNGVVNIDVFNLAVLGWYI